jgi:hypothetical protein
MRAWGIEMWGMSPSGCFDLAASLDCSDQPGVCVSLHQQQQRASHLQSKVAKGATSTYQVIDSSAVIEYLLGDGFI